MNSIQQIMGQQSAAGYQNVPEALTLCDTILICGYAKSLKWHDGYFGTFALAGQANSWPFFNVRNRNHGLAYNNQDTRDTLAYAFEIYSIGVDFWAPAVIQQQQYFAPNGSAEAMLSYQNMSALWICDLPRHASIKFNVNQDEKLNATCCMVPPGMGPVGGGAGQGDFATLIPPPFGGAPEVLSPMYAALTQGTPEITSRFKFPNPIQIPRRASITAVITLSEYGRQLLQTMTGPWYYKLLDKSEPATTAAYKWAAFGVTVSLQGKRLIQQRGAYHA